MPDAPLTMTDVVGALALEGWEVHYAGTPEPRECWLRRGASSIGLFQESSGVRIVVWVGFDMRSRTLERIETDLRAWIDDAVEAQRAAHEADEAEKRRRAALPLPALEEVVALLRAGHRVVTSGGRYHETYYWDAASSGLRMSIFDEGDVSDRGVTEKKLAAEIARVPDPFRDALASLKRS